jgi:hypothetical protein
MSARLDVSYRPAQSINVPMIVDYMHTTTDDFGSERYASICHYKHYGTLRSKSSNWITLACANTCR